MIPQACKRLAEVDFPIAEVARELAAGQTGSWAGFPKARQRLVYPCGSEEKRLLDGMLLAVPR